MNDLGLFLVSALAVLSALCLLLALVRREPEPPPPALWWPRPEDCPPVAPVQRPMPTSPAEWDEIWAGRP